MRIRKRMDRAFEQGKRDALDGLRLNTGKIEHPDGRYTEYAYAAGYRAGEYRRRSAMRAAANG